MAAMTPNAQVVQINDTQKKGKKLNKSFKRANTNVGIMNRFILQFSRVEKAYRNIEEAFNSITQTVSPKGLKQRMKRKCSIKKMRDVLKYLGFPDNTFTDDELKTNFDKDPKTNSNITFQRVLIGVGLCYFMKLDKDKNIDDDNDGSEIIHDDNPSVIIPPTAVIVDDDDDDDDNKQNDNELRYASLQSGFDVVKKMFDVIDDDGSGEISSQEFQQAFTDICKDPLIVKQRMKELDYNNDQNISFREFIFGISSWCGFNDEMLNDDNDKDLDNPTSSPVKPNNK